MLAPYAETQYQPEHGAGPVHRSVPIPGVTVLRCVFSAAGPRHAGRHASGHWEAILCTTGRLQIQRMDGRAESIGPGELLLLTDSAQAESFTLEFVPADFLVVDVDRQALGGFFSEPWPPSDLISDLHRLWAQIDRLGGCLVLRDPDWSNSILAALRRLPPERHGTYFALRLPERLYILCREDLPGETQLCCCDRCQKEAVGRVHDYILATLDEPSTIQKLAQRFQMSPTYLKESFRRVYGKPIHTYLQQYRLQRAAHLLCTTSEQVLTIAARVGYSGTSRFNAAFKEMYHVTPTQYRRMASKKMSETVD